MSKSEPPENLTDSLNASLRPVLTAHLAPAIEPIAEILRVLKDVDDARRPQDILNSMLDRALTVAKADRAEIALWDADKKRLQIVALRGKRGPATGDVGDSVPSDGMIMRMWKRRKAEPIVETHPVPGKGYHPVDRRTQAEAAFPLHRRSTKFGVLNVEWFRRAHLTDDRVANLGLLAEHAALAMDIVDHAKLVADLASGLAAKHDVSESVCRVLEGIRDTYGFDRALVYQADDRRRCLDARFVLISHKARAVKSKPWSYGFDETSLAVHAYISRRARFVHDPSHPKHAKYVNRKGLKKFGIRGPLLALPLIYGGKPVGSIVIWSHSQPVPTESDKFALKPIADLVAAYLGSSSESGGTLVPFELLKTVFLQSQRAISPDDAITTILHAVQAYGFDRARYLRFDEASKCFIRGPQFAIGEVPRRKHVVIDARKSPYAAYLTNTFHLNPDARIFDPRSADSFGKDPDCKKLGKSPHTPWIAVPVALQGRLIGQLAADNETSKREIPPVAKHFMTLTAGITALVLSRLSEIDFSLLNAIPIAMFRKDVEGRFLSVNERFASDAGKSIEQVKGMRDSDLYRADLAKKFREDDERVMTTQQVDGWVEENVTRKRKTFVHVVKAPLFDASRRVIGVQGLYLDEPYRAIFENSTEGIYQSTLDGQYIDANRAMAQLLGYSSRKELLEAKVDIAKRIYASPDDREYFRQKIRRKGWISNFESNIRRKDGTQIKVAEYAWEVRDRNKKLLHYEGIVRDISSQIKASARVSKAQAEGLARHMAIMMAHEVSNVIECIGIDLSELKRVVTNITAGEASTIPNILSGMTAQVEEACSILDLYMAGEPDAIYAPAEVDKAIGFARKIMNLSALRVGVRCDLFSRAPGARVDMSEVELIQVLVNLIKNSVTAAQRNGAIGARIQVRTSVLRRSQTGSAARILIEYEDTAGGMNQETLRSLFQRSKLSDPHEKGVGMLVVSKLIDSVGGTIFAASKQGKGTSFSITLPLHSDSYLAP